MKRIILIFAFILIATSSVFAWGREAHEVDEKLMYVPQAKGDALYGLDYATGNLAVCRI